MAIVDADGRAVRPASSYIESAQYGTRKGVEKNGNIGETQTLCIHNCILNIEEQKSETDQESLNVVKRCSTDFRTPWNPGRPPPQMFKVYIVSR